MSEEMQNMSTENTSKSQPKPQKSTDSQLKSKSRRRLLQSSTKAGMATLAVGGGYALGKDVIPLTSIASAAGNADAFSIPIDLNSTYDFELFIRALGDEKVRAGLSKEQGTLPPSARQLLLMADDQVFLQKGIEAAVYFNDFLHLKASIEQFQSYAQDFSNYMTTTYPGGYSALRDFATKMHPQFVENEQILRDQVTKVMKGDPVGSPTNPFEDEVDFPLTSAAQVPIPGAQSAASPQDTCIGVVACAAANALVVVNAVLYTNVAGATLVAVAAAVCAVVAICPAVSTDICVSAAGNL